MDFSKALELIKDKISVWMHDLVKMLPNILLATLVLVIGLFIARIIKKFALRLIKKVSERKTLNNLFGSVVYIFLIGIVLFTVLSILQLDKAVTSVLAGAGIIGLALAFAFQDIASNFISGIFISFRRPIRTGDIVKLGDYMGKVQDVNLRDTVLITFQGQMVIIPNKEVFQNPIENFSLLGKRRLDLAVGVSYGEDLERVTTITLEAVKDLDGLVPDEEITMFYREFGDSSINFMIRMWLSNPEQLTYWKASDQAIKKIKKAYDKNDIMIPFPIRTLDFGIKGGQQLSEMKINIGDKNPL